MSDIVVTARKRDEKLIDVPISIQAFSQAEIKSSGIDDLQTLKSRAGFEFPPQVSNGPAGRFQGVLIFRGLQANSFGQPRDNSGSLFVDGIYISGGLQSVNTADVARIEVLKGPQNAYFGRGTFGGAVNFITRNPSEKFGGEINARATARGTIDGDFSLEGALAPDLLTARVTAYTHDKVAQYHATDGGDLGAEKTQGATITLYATPSSNSWIRLRGTYQRDDDSAPSFAFISANAQAQGCIGKPVPGFNGRNGAAVTLAREYFCNGVPSLDDVRAFTNPALSAGPTALVGSGVITSNTALPAFVRNALRSKQTTAGVPGRFYDNIPTLNHAGLRRDTIQLSNQAGYTFDSGAALAFNAGYNQQNSVAFNDVDKTDVQSFASILAYKTRDVTVDGRFTSDPTKRIRLLVGGSYFYGKTVYSQMDVQYASSTVTQGAITNERARTPAVYASIDFDILKNLTVTAEGRYQGDTITSFNAAGAKVQQTFKNFLPRAIVSFKPIENTNIYASYSRGVQPAGVNSGYASLSALPFAAQAMAYVQSQYPGVGLFSLLPKLDAYELGIKQKLFGGVIDYTLAVYQNDWANAVVSSALFNPAACYPAGAPVIANTAACPLSTAGTTNLFPNNARIRGAEFAVTGRVTPDWAIDLTVDYKNAKWRRYANSGFNVMTGLNSAAGDVYRGDGNHLGRVPALSGTLSSTYRHEIGSNGWSYFVRGDALYTGKAWDSDLNIFKTDDYVRVNARIGFERENLTLELFSTNLFNNKTYDVVANTVELAGNFTQRAAAVIPAQKREFGFRTQVKF